MKLRIRNGLFFVFLLLSVIPLILSSWYFLKKISTKMQKVNRQIYSDSIEQVVSSIDFYYNRYAIDFIDIEASSEFKEIYHTEIRPAGDSPLVTKVQGKMSGDFCFLDLKYPDKARDTWYTLKLFNASADVNLDIDSFLHSAPFVRMQASRQMAPLVGMLLSFYGYQLNKCLYFFCPIFENGEISGVMIDIEKPDFIQRLYDSNTSLKKGTIYLVDQFDNIIHYNHPSSSDYYEYDETKARYILGPDDVAYDASEGMSYSEYSMLNTDKNILKDSETLNLVEQYRAGERIEPATGMVKYKNRCYFSVFSRATASGMKVFYFYPQQQLASPLGHTPVLEFIIIFFVLSGVSVLLAWLCSRIVCYHQKDIKAAAREVIAGNYNVQLPVSCPLIELTETKEIINSMICAMKKEQEKLKDTAESTELQKEIFNAPVSVLAIQVILLQYGINNQLDLTFSIFDKIMLHNHCTRLGVRENIYFAVCEVHHTEYLLKAALTCTAYIRKIGTQSCTAGIHFEKVLVGNVADIKLSQIQHPNEMQVMITEETYQLIKRKFKCRPIRNGGYIVEGIFRKLQEN